MDKVLKFDGKKYISAKLAAEITGYTSDYVGQLCRGKKINSRLVGRSWYVLEKDLLDHKSSHHAENSKNKKSSKETETEISKSKSVSVKNPSPKKVISKDVQNIVAPIPSVFNAPKNVLHNFKNKPEISIQNEKSRVAEIKKDYVLYNKDNKDLFPNLVKSIDLDSLKYTADQSLNNALKAPRNKSHFEKFTTTLSLLSLCLLLVFGIFANKEHVSKLTSTHFVQKVGQELSYLSEPTTQKIVQKQMSLFKKVIHLTPQITLHLSNPR